MRFFLPLLAVMLLGAGCASATPAAKVIDSTTMIEEPAYAFPGVLAAEEIEGKRIRISTAKGDIVFELFADTAPKTVSNFVYLTNKGYYGGLAFHRREEGFVIQGGDPKGNGSGGPGYTFEDELDDGYKYDRGIVAMANRGPDTNGSQFFIMLADYPLPKNYTIFGRVVEGMEVVDEIAVGDVMTRVMVEDAK
jgi:cyclophilin family peptidyl-prolyl cis-trans isomerase